MEGIEQRWTTDWKEGLTVDHYKATDTHGTEVSTGTMRYHGEIIHIFDLRRVLHSDYSHWVAITSTWSHKKCIWTLKEQVRRWVKKD